MPTLGKRWRHILLHTHGTWLHGDSRGFRSRGHRIHSSGDYRNPPPPGEHLRLHLYHFHHSADPTTLPKRVFQAMGDAIVENLQKQNHLLAAVYVGAKHTHFLCELPDDVERIRKICGWCKYFATRAARKVDAELANVETWAEGEGYKPVDNPGHFQNAVNYILFRQNPTGWIWEPSDPIAW